MALGWLKGGFPLSTRRVRSWRERSRGKESPEKEGGAGLGFEEDLDTTAFSLGYAGEPVVVRSRAKGLENFDDAVPLAIVTGILGSTSARENRGPLGLEVGSAKVGLVSRGETGMERLETAEVEEMV